MEDQYNTYEETLSSANQVYTKNGLPSKPRMNQSYCNVNISQEPKKRSWKNAWRASALFLAIAILVTLTILLIWTFSNTEGNSEASNSQQPTMYPNIETCLDLKHKGVTTSGIKSLKLHNNRNELHEVYCDMETGGGGWTLVASIHESDITTKCTHDDRWSAYIWDRHYQGKTNWENEITFGHVRDCLRDDYKNDGYYEINASDVMVWHVRSQQDLDSLESGTMLRYRSANQFLQNYGGNLKNLFSDFFPIADHNIDHGAKVLQAVSKHLPVKNYISNWYDYNMIPNAYQIIDSKIFGKYGNQLYFQSSRYSTTVYYGRNVTLPCHSTIFSTSTPPSMLLILVRNDEQLSNHYILRVTSYIGVKNYSSRFARSMEIGNFTIYYSGIQFYGLSKELKTECRFHFYVSSSKVWNSKHPSGISEYSTSTGSNGYRYIGYGIAGHPARLLFGYMLLSRDSGMIYSESDLDAVADSILRSVHKFQHDLMRAQSDSATVTVPVTFDQGSIGDLVEKIPTEMRSQVQGGNLQFRAYNLDGYANALCPGIRVNGVEPEYVCVGGVSNDISTYGTCGDFAGWYGVQGVVPAPKKPSTYGHSLEDIASTLLIFYR